MLEYHSRREVHAQSDSITEIDGQESQGSDQTHCHRNNNLKLFEVFWGHRQQIQEQMTGPSGGVHPIILSNRDFAITS